MFIVSRRGPIKKLHKLSLPLPVGSLLCRPVSSPAPILDPTRNPNPVSCASNRSFFHVESSYSRLYLELKSPSTLRRAQKLHAVLLVNGFLTSRCTDGGVYASQLVKVYAAFGCLEDALNVFDSLPHRKTLAWNSIIRGYLDAGWFSEAMGLYQMMLHQGVVPDNFTYPLVLKACSGLNDVEKGTKIRDQIRWNETSLGIKRNVYVECALIDMFAKCGCLREALLVFERIREKDLVCWSAMICGYVQNGECLVAIRLFWRMRLEGLTPDSVILAALFPACGRLENKKMGMALHGCAVSCGVDNDLYVSNATMDMYCKCGDTYFAYSIFCRMKNKDLVSWSTIIAGYSQNFRYNESLQLYLMMINAGLRTNGVIAASVLLGLGNLKLLRLGKEMHNYILKQGFESDIILGSALIDMYANCRSIKDAEHIFDIMATEDITIWNSLIAGYSLNGATDSCFMIFQKIWDFNLRPSCITLVSVLPVCAEMSNLRHGKEIHGYAIRSSLGTAIAVGNSLLDMYCKCGYLTYGEIVYNQMSEKSTVSYNTLISAYGMHGLGEHAYQIFEQMKAENIRPNEITFVGLLAACSHAGLVERGWSLYNCMINDYNITPSKEHYSCMVDLLGRAGYIDDAYSIICMMPEEPDMNVLGCFLAACQVHKRVELAEIVEKYVLQKVNKDSGHHILLSNIYSSTGRWDDSSKFRLTINQKGIKKRPGGSWFQTTLDKHVFYVRDVMKPESDEN